MTDLDPVGSNQEPRPQPYPYGADLDRYDPPVQHQGAYQSQQVMDQVQDESLDPRLLLEADEAEFNQGIENQNVRDEAAVPDAQASALPQVAPVVNTPEALPLTEFPMFVNFPREIQVMIFTEAIRKPNIHKIQAKYDPDKDNGKWSLSFAPIPKGKDNSGFRRAMDIATVNRVGYAAVRLATQHHQATLPFKKLRARIDGVQDLVLIEIAESKGDALPYFHPDHQILNNPGSAFDADKVAAQFAGIERIGLRFREVGRKAHSFKCNFRCVTHRFPPHRDHMEWPMCPKEVCGLLNCFPDLREFYLTLDYTHNSNYQTYKAKVYTQNYYSVPATHPFRLPLTTFHTATGLSYIELDPAFIFDAHTTITTNPHPNPNPNPNPNGPANNPPQSQPQTTVTFSTINYTEVTYALLAELLDPSTGEFLLDNDVNRSTPAERARLRAGVYRLSLERRRGLRARVLIAVPEEEQVGWPGGEKGDGVRRYLGV